VFFPALESYCPCILHQQVSDISRNMEKQKEFLNSVKMTQKLINDKKKKKALTGKGYKT
jgi:hypothetical protein